MRARGLHVAVRSPWDTTSRQTLPAQLPNPTTPLLRAYMTPTRKFHVSSTSAHQQHNAQSPPHTQLAAISAGDLFLFDFLSFRAGSASILGHRTVSGSGRRCSGGLGDAVWIYVGLGNKTCLLPGFWIPVG